MEDIPPLAALGRRIMICGPSNAGKSTLAVALGRRLELPVVHLDRLHHLPNTDWVPRPTEDYLRLHDEAIAADAWVMDGNYTRSMPQRLQRASFVILADDGRLPGLLRYLRRTLVQKRRLGALDGARDSVKWRMVHWIVAGAPPRQRAMRALIVGGDQPVLEVHGMAGMKRLYAAWGLAVPRG